MINREVKHMNKVIVMGRLTKEVELKKNDNYTVAVFSLAVDRKYVKQGEERKTDFFNVVAYGKNAEFINKYFSKGQLVIVSGRMENRTWTDKDGNNRLSTEVICEESYFAEGKKNPNNENAEMTETGELNVDSSDDDLPF